MASSVRLATELERTLGSRPTRWQPLGGGDIAQAFRVALEDGREVFVKTLADAQPMFEAEARGLAWLRDGGGPAIPEVLGVGPPDAPFLALELVSRGTPAPSFDEALGRGLAALHRAGAPTFGLNADNFIGALPQRNTPHPTWPAFYREARLQPLVARAVRERRLSPRTAREFETLLGKLEALCGPPEPPARLHGDLWSGNLLCSAQGLPVLIDPAVYGGHREIDLAMMRLFGGFSSRTFAAYQEAAPLSEGAEERVRLYQLYPLLVHVNLFGAGYVGQTEAALRSYL